MTARSTQPSSTFADRRRICNIPMPVFPIRLLRVDVRVSAEQRRIRFEEGWQRGGINALSAAYTDFFTDETANRQAQDFARKKIREIVRDPATAELLCPKHHIGTKRTCVDIGYFETYNRDNVELIDVRAHPIERITPTVSNCLTGSSTSTSSCSRSGTTPSPARSPTSTSAEPMAYCCGTNGPTVPAHCSGSRPRASPTFSRSPVPAARRC